MNTVKLLADKVTIIFLHFASSLALSDIDVKQVERAKGFLGSDR